jgi:hypothetical protein
MDLHDNTISWMIAGGRSGDPEELRNRANLQALRLTETRPSLPDRVRAFLTRSTPLIATPVDRVCCVG